MNIEEFHIYCTSKKGVTESFPFDKTTLVFKVMNKMFALIGLDDDELSTNLKCDPDRAIYLRENHADIIPGYHMNKKHWNTVRIDNELDDEMVFELIDHSYDLIVKSLKKGDQELLRNL